MSAPAPWTPTDDRYLLTHRHRLTIHMLAEDLHRTPDGVRNRYAKLKRQMKPRIPDITVERQAVRDTVLHALALQIVRQQMTCEQAWVIGRRLKIMLDYPDRTFEERKGWTVAQWLRELGA